MSEDVWPFLIGRTRHAGYRVVVVPDFMADPAQVSALSSATPTVDLPSDAASVRELRGTGSGPLALVYRCYNPRGTDFGLVGHEALTDAFGRPIQVTEGLAVRRPAKEAMRLHITIADFEHAHGQMAEAYRDFWQQDDAFVRRTAGALQLGTNRGETTPLRLVPADSWSPQPVFRDPQPTSPVPSPAPFPRIGAVVVMVGGIGILLTVGLVVHNVTSKPTVVPATAVLKPTVVPATTVLKPTVVPATTVLEKFCRALIAGEPETANGYTTQEFNAVMPADARAKECTFTVRSATAATAVGTLTVITESGASIVWTVTLSPGDDGAWQVSMLTPVPGGGRRSSLENRLP